MQVQSEMEAEGYKVGITQLSRWFNIPRRTLYYRPKQKRKPKLDETKVARVKEKIEAFPSYGYRRLALLLGMNKKAVQRILQIKGWQVRKRPKGHRPRAKAMPSRTNRINERWAIDMTRIWCGKDGWSTLAAVIDTCNREVVGFRLSSSGKSQTAEAALQESIIYRFGRLERLRKPITLRSDNGLVFSSKAFTKTVKDYNLTQEFITPYTPQQNGMIERFFRTIKEECIWHHNFKSIKEANEIISKWIDFYNNKRKHSALRYKIPAEVFQLAA
jgi:putative transposase